MCNGFGVIVTKDCRYLFCEPNKDGDVSHSEILERAGIKENTDPFNRAFVRVEIPTWKIGSFRFDENETLPGWVDEDAVKTRCNKLLKRVAPAWAEYEKVRAPARAEYEKVRDSARAEYEKVRDSAWAEYEKVCAPAWAEYEKACDSARAEYEKVRDSAWAEYEKVCDSARAEYEKVCDSARAEYEKVCDSALDEFVEKISKIDGYVS